MRGWDCPMTSGFGRTRTIPSSPSASVGRLFSSSVCTRTPAERRAASRPRRSSSTCTTSSSNFGQMDATTNFGTGLSSGISGFRVRSIPCWRPMARRPRLASTAGAPSTTLGSAPFIPGARLRVRHEIPPRSGVAFTLNRGQKLTVIDPHGQQVADLLAFNRADPDEVISSGRTLDYVSRIFLTKGDPIYSNRSNILLRIVADTVGRHNFFADALFGRHVPDHLQR